MFTFSLLTTNWCQNFEHNEYVKAKIEEAIESKDETTVDAIANKYLEDVKEGRLKEWGKSMLQYRESKLFVNIYTRVLAAQLLSRPEGEKIYVNAICPGAMKTAMLSSFVNKVGASKAEELTAYVRWTTVEDAGIACSSLSLLPVEKCSMGHFYAKKLEDTAW